MLLAKLRPTVYFCILVLRKRSCIHDSCIFIANGLNRSVKVIPINSEKYTSIIKTIPHHSGNYYKMIKLKFIDSFKFVPESLDKLASLIPSERKTLLRKEFPTVCEEQIHLLERKCVFCYDYVDSWKKLNETSLPSQEAFSSSFPKW